MKKYLLLFVVCFELISCNIVSRKGFTYYKEPVSHSLPFSINGAWYKIDSVNFGPDDRRLWVDFYFFNGDGTVCKGDPGLTDTMLSTIARSIKGYYRYVEGYNKDDAGAFKISGDTLKVQLFSTPPQNRFYNIGVAENHFLIKHDSDKIYLFSRYAKWENHQHSGYDKHGIKKFDPPVEYKFLPLDSKPDSTKMWFKKESWYKK